MQWILSNDIRSTLQVHYIHKIVRKVPCTLHILLMANTQHLIDFPFILEITATPGSNELISVVNHLNLSSVAKMRVNISSANTVHVRRKTTYPTTYYLIGMLETKTNIFQQQQRLMSAVCVT